MEAGSTVDRVDTHTVTGCRTFQVLIGNRLYGGNTFASFFLVLTQCDKLLQRVGLDIELLAQHIHLLGGRNDQFGIGQTHQVFIPIGPAEAGLTDGFGDRFRLEDRAVEVFVALLYVIQDFQRIVQAQRKHFVLRLQQLVFLL